MFLVVKLSKIIFLNTIPQKSILGTIVSPNKILLRWGLWGQSKVWGGVEGFGCYCLDLLIPESQYWIGVFEGIAPLK